MKVIEAPKIRFKCDHCGATNEGEEHEFTERMTMPPSFLAYCGYCRLSNVVYPTALIAKVAGRY